MMKSIVMVLCLVLLASCASRRTCEVAHSHPSPDGVKQIMREIVIPKIDLRRAPVRDVITFLMDTSVHHDPQHRGISTLFIMPRGTDVDGPTSPFQELMADTGPYVTIVAERMTFLQLLEDICRQADLVWRITANKLVITPRKG